LGIITALDSRKAFIDEFDNRSKISIRSINEKKSVQDLPSPGLRVNVAAYGQKAFPRKQQ